MNKLKIVVQFMMVAFILTSCLAFEAIAVEYAPLCVEIGPDHPLLVFQVSVSADDAGAHGRFQLEWISDRDHPVADLKLV